jgi:hypothetical protein
MTNAICEASPRPALQHLSHKLFASCHLLSASYGLPQIRFAG